MVFHNTREMLQYIGTDVIRFYNPNWHVNRIREMIESSKNYVIDDLRFENEKSLIEEMNGFMFFVVRPNLEQLSNHISETSLKWQMFSTIIINDDKIENLKFKWENFLKYGLIKSMTKRSKLIHDIANNETLKESLLESLDNLDTFKLFFINKEELTYNDKFRNPLIKEVIDKLENIENNSYLVHYKTGEKEMVTNPLMIEDLKFFDRR